MSQGLLITRGPNRSHVYLLCHAWLICWGLLLLSGCATLSKDYETPTVTINSFRALPAEQGMPVFEIGLRVVNPNREPLELQGIAYTISLEGRELITGVGKDLPIIQGYSEGNFTVTAKASLYEGIRLFSDIINSPRDTLSYEISSKLDIGAFQPAIRVRDAGEISLAPPAN